MEEPVSDVQSFGPTDERIGGFEIAFVHGLPGTAEQVVDLLASRVGFDLTQHRRQRCIGIRVECSGDGGRRRQEQSKCEGGEDITRHRSHDLPIKIRNGTAASLPRDDSEQTVGSDALTIAYSASVGIAGASQGREGRSGGSALRCAAD
ncbi:MAG: hypothetical protein C0483_07145 [Pirellula sp.]|nr:hypothetical protein [Pirellula sp.]